MSALSRSAPSNADIIYAGTGDPISGSLGNGMWKSTDAGSTWKHIGLEDTVKISSIVVDPANPNVVLVSALGTLRITAAVCTVPRTVARPGPAF